MGALLFSSTPSLASWWSRRTLAQRFATLAAALIAGSAIIQGAILIGAASNIVGDLESERVAQRLDTAADQFTQRIEEFRRVPLILSGTPPIERIVKLSTGAQPKIGESLETWLQRLGIIFRSFVQANPALTQARFIGVADGGRELVRVNRIGDTTEIVKKDKLQRKGDRAYFNETAKLKPGQVYLSPVDANVENGVVVRPFQTVIRAGTPIYSDEGKLFGIIIANVAANSWLREFTELSGIPGRLLVANQSGDYIFRSNGGPLFGSVDGSPMRFQRDWPSLRRIFGPGTPASISQRDGKQFLTARRVNYDPAKPGEFIVLTADVDADKVFGDTWTFTLLGAGTALVLSAIGLLAAFFVSRPLKALMGAAKEIAAGKLDPTALGERGRGADIGELGEALRIMKDAVERRDASLRKSEAQLHAIVDNTIDGLITIDRRGIILRYNRGCEDIFGYDPDEAIGSNVSLLMGGADARRHDSYLQRYERTGEARFIGKRREVIGRHKSGRPLDIEVAIAEIRVGGEVLFSGIVQDVTERKKVERMKSEFVSTVTHELRTPLTSIMGSLGLLRSGALGALPDKATRMANLAHDNGERLVHLINDILDIDKIEAGTIEFKRRSENVKDIIQEAATNNSVFAKQCGVEINLAGVEDGIVIETDRNRLLQVMDNLLSNAAKFSPRGTTVSVAAKMIGNNVRVSVTDQGSGIPLEFRDHVFEKFAQADSSDKREKGGTGLGLNIARAIIERLGGEIGFETEIGVGTTFYFSLPANRETKSLPAETDEDARGEGRFRHVSPSAATQAGFARALHVDEDEGSRAVLAELIADIAHVIPARTAEEARAYLAKESFDLVVLEMQLPAGGGEAILRYLSERDGAAPPVLVFSVTEISTHGWPLIADALVKARTDVSTLRSHIIALLQDERPGPWLQRIA